MNRIVINETDLQEITSKILIPLFIVFGAELLYRIPLMEFSRSFVPKL